MFQKQERYFLSLYIDHDPRSALASDIQEMEEALLVDEHIRIGGRALLKFLKQWTLSLISCDDDNMKLQQQRQQGFSAYPCVVIGFRTTDQFVVWTRSIGTFPAVICFCD